jgi:hypothetical protein
VPQALVASKFQTKTNLDVGGLQFAPNMTIILAVRALHLSKMGN